jgi:hypothetical protein
MMLNPTKCVFGVPAGKLLGFIVEGEPAGERRRCGVGGREDHAAHISLVKEEDDKEGRFHFGRGGLGQR